MIEKLRELEETILGDNASPDVMAAARETRASLAHHLLPLAEALEKERCHAEPGQIACDFLDAPVCSCCKALKALESALNA